MKKIFLAAALLLGLANAASADPFGFGIKGGVNMANQVSSFNEGTTQITSDVLFGFNGGIFMDFQLAGILSLQPEAEFSMKGFQQNIHHIPEVDSSAHILGYIDGFDNFSFNYLEFPLLLKVHGSMGPDLQGFLLLGPSLSFLISANTHYSFAGIGTGGSVLNGAVFDYGLNFGGGLEIGKVILDLRYDLGLASVINHFSEGNKNSVLSLEFGYRIQ